LQAEVDLQPFHFSQTKEYQIPTYSQEKPTSITDFSPYVFWKIRKLFNILNDKFQMSLGPSQLFGSLNQVISNWKEWKCYFQK